MQLAVVLGNTTLSLENWQRLQLAQMPCGLLLPLALPGKYKLVVMLGSNKTAVSRTGIQHITHHQHTHRDLMSKRHNALPLVFPFLGFVTITYDTGLVLFFLNSTSYKSHLLLFIYLFIISYSMGKPMYKSITNIFTIKYTPWINHKLQV